LEVFDLKDLSSLPKLKEIKAFGAEEYQPTPMGEDDSQDQQNDEEATETDDSIKTGETVLPEEGSQAPEGDTRENTLSNIDPEEESVDEGNGTGTKDQ
jgi:hypothetical protein